MPRQCWGEGPPPGCSNCGGSHPSDECRQPDKVINVPYPVANPQQVAMDNMRGERGQHGGNQNELKPPNIYYDHGNARETFHPPAGLQTAVGYIPINLRPTAPPANEGNVAGPSNVGRQPATQDVRFMGTPEEYPGEEQCTYGPRPEVIIGSMHPEGNTWLPNVNVMTHELRNPEVMHLALAVVARAMKGKQTVEEEGSEGEGSSLEEPPPLSDLGRVDTLVFVCSQRFQLWSLLLFLFQTSTI